MNPSDKISDIVNSCPLCGATVDKIELKACYRKGVANRKKHWIVCRACNFTQLTKYPDGFKSFERAIETWNNPDIWKNTDI